MQKLYFCLGNLCMTTISFGQRSLGLKTIYGWTANKYTSALWIMIKESDCCYGNMALKINKRFRVTKLHQYFVVALPVNSLLENNSKSSKKLIVKLLIFHGKLFKQFSYWLSYQSLLTRC